MRQQQRRPQRSEGFGELRLRLRENAILRWAVDRLLASSAVERRARGIIASDGSSVMLSISETLRNPVSRLSSRKDTTMPPNRLKISVVRIMVDCG